MTPTDRDPRMYPRKHDVTRKVNDVGYELRRTVERVLDHGQRVEYNVYDSVKGTTTSGYTVVIAEWRSRNRGAEVIHCAD